MIYRKEGKIIDILNFNPEDILDKAFTSQEIKLITKAISDCYSKVRNEIDSGPLEGLRSPAGKKAYPFISYLEVEQKLAQLANQGKLSYKVTWKKIPKNGDKYLLLSKKVAGVDIQITINQTESSNKVSRYAKCRDALNQNNQLSLFEDENDVDSSKIYLELNHGCYYNSKPKFIVLGLPAEDNSWIAQKSLLLETQKTTINKKLQEDLDVGQDVEFAPDELFDNPDEKKEKEDR